MNKEFKLDESDLNNSNKNNNLKFSDSSNSEIELLPFEKIKQEYIVRKKAETSKKYGCYPDKRPIDVLINYGVVNIDKPSGPTSHQVSSYVQRILGISKSGHAGTLDPKVTGVLPVALGRATKVVHTLLSAGKEYVGIMHLHKDVPQHEIYKISKEFIGSIRQLPPLRSSVKRDWRIRNIYYFSILEVDGRDILFKVGCQAGTYIRKLVHDIGQKIGCGAHMSELRRTKAGPFDESTLVTLQDLTDAFYYYKKEGNEKYLRHCIQPVENAVMHLPKVFVLDSTVDSLCHGANLNLPGVASFEKHIKRGDTVAVFTLKGELILYGTSMLNAEEFMGEKGIAVKTERVFMEPGTYPSMKKI